MTGGQSRVENDTANRGKLKQGGLIRGEGRSRSSQTQTQKQVPIKLKKGEKEVQLLNKDRRCGLPSTALWTKRKGELTDGPCCCGGRKGNIETGPKLEKGEVGEGGHQKS